MWIGYAWADEPRNHAVVKVNGDDKEKVIKYPHTSHTRIAT
ncbi:M81 family metallopeptidase [Arenibacter sp. 6A1]|nr:hypothetical protein [Arenibacter sp. 6A1]